MCFLPIFGLNWSVLNLEHGDVFSCLMPLLSWQKNKQLTQC